MREMHRKKFAPPPSSKTMLVRRIVGSRLPRSCCSEGAQATSESSPPNRQFSSSHGNSP